jgi:hypothetical protein
MSTVTPTRDQAATAKRISVLADRLHVSTDDALSAMEALASGTPAGSATPAAALTESEEAALREAGSLRHALPAFGDRASTKTAVATLQLQAEALTVKQAAAKLKVTEGRIRQRLAARTLFGIPTSGGWRIPLVQFGTTGLVRGLEQVLPALRSDAHPLVVEHFLSSPHVDLILDREQLSPLEWLASGGDVSVVVELAEALHDLP